MATEVTRRLSFCAGHRVLGHESKCRNPHGHNYVVEITAEGELDKIGRVVDFSVIKELVGAFIEMNLDHVFLVYEKDREVIRAFGDQWPVYIMAENPTAENIGRLLLQVSNELLESRGVHVTKIVVHETENCKAEVRE